MENEKIRKIDWVYTLIFILAPVLIIALGLLVGLKLPAEGGVGPLIPVLAFAVALVWWVMGGKSLLKKGADRLAKQMDEQGLTRSMTFNGSGCVVAVDVNHGKLGLVYKMNPNKQYIIDASRVEKAWVDDGKSGKGITEGSGRVSFLFTVDGVTSRVDTFTSNQRFRMDDRRILTGISKADSMVELIRAAKGAR